MIKYLMFFVLLSACSHKMSHTKHGVIVFDNIQGERVVSNKNFKSTACNKLFIFIPYEVQMFGHDEKFQKELKEMNAVGVANAEMIETFSYNFFKLKWCQTLSGKLLL